MIIIEPDKLKKLVKKYFYENVKNQITIIHIIVEQVMRLKMNKKILLESLKITC